MSHTCQCQTATRRLALVVGRLAARHPELGEAVSRFGWDWDEDLGTAVATVGPDARFRGAGELLDVIAGVLGAEEAQAVSATWLDDRPLAAQAGALLRAPALRELAPDGDSPLGRILEQRAIETWFQPIVPAAGGAPWGYECLMRARDPDDGQVIPPVRLLDWARREHLLFMLDRVCRERHIANAGAAHTASDAVFLLNFLPTVIYEPEFCLRSTVAALQDTDLSPQRIVFEVVETERIADSEHLRRILEYYRRNGFRVALDDLSAGYPSLSLLADLEPDLIKIDREIVARSVDSQAHADVCRALVELGHGRSRMVLAEGVETPEQRDFLRGLGVDLLQGFLFGYPAPEPVLAVG